MKKLLGIVVLGLLFYSAANAGVILGAPDCGKILETKDDKQNERIVSSWVNGFITGLNFAQVVDSENVGENSSYEQRYHYILKYCRENPLKNLNEAAATLYFELNK